MFDHVSSFMKFSCSTSNIVLMEHLELSGIVPSSASVAAAPGPKFQFQLLLVELP